jgi:hypothetical protein
MAYHFLFAAALNRFWDIYSEQEYSFDLAWKYSMDLPG